MNPGRPCGRGFCFSLSLGFCFHAAKLHILQRSPFPFARDCRTIAGRGADVVQMCARRRFRRFSCGAPIPNAEFELSMIPVQSAENDAGPKGSRLGSAGLIRDWLWRCSGFPRSMVGKNVRLLTAVAISGVLHVGLFIAGAGLSARLLAGMKDIRRVGTLTVSMAPAAAPRDSIASPAEPDRQAVRHDEAAHHARPPHAHRSEEPRIANAAHRSGHKSSSNAHRFPPSDPVAVKRAARRRTTSNTRGVEPGGRRDARQPATHVAGGPTDSSPRSAAPESGAADAAQEAVARTYLGEFLAALSRYKHYPQAARLRREEGKVVVALVLRSDGSIDDVRVKEASRFPLLNRAALRTVAQLDRFKPFPADIHRAEWHLSVPFKYTISDH